MSTTYFTDSQVDDMCAGLTQDAAKIRFLRRLGLRVDRKPNGRPLAWLPATTHPAPADAQNAAQQEASVAVGLQAWATARKGRNRNGQKTQGR